MQFTRPGTRGEAQLRPVGAQAPPPIPENILGVKEFGPIGTPMAQDEAPSAAQEGKEAHAVARFPSS